MVKTKKKAKAKKKVAVRAKRPKRKAARKKKTRAKVAPRVKKVVKELVAVGEVTHFFPHVKAGVIKVKSGGINIGDTLLLKGHTSDFKQKVSSMQVNHVPVKKAKKGDEIGLLVKKRVRIGDTVYKI